VCCRDTENWFSSSNDDVEGRKYYVRSSFDQTHNKASIYIYIYVCILLYGKPDETTVEKNIELRWRRNIAKYGSSLPSIHHSNSLSVRRYIIYNRYTLHTYIYMNINISVCLYVYNTSSSSAHCTLEIYKIGEWKSNARKFRFVPRTMWRRVCTDILLLLCLSI